MPDGDRQIHALAASISPIKCSCCIDLAETVLDGDVMISLVAVVAVTTVIAVISARRRLQ
jgi:hypothetical protein